MTKKSRLPLFLACLVGLLAGPSIVQAAPKAPVTGITLSPFEQQFSIAPDEPSKNFTLNLTNNTSSLQELKLTARDFGSLNDTGGVLLEGNTNYTRKYGLSSWLVLGTDTVVLQPGESRGVPISIDNRSSLQPGGHYGAVVASVTSLDAQSGGNHVAINQQLLSLVLVNKVGGAHYDLRLPSLSQNGNWLHVPDTVRLRFQNPGNVHVVPRGSVKLTSPSGTVLATGIINSESAFVLPESFRELYVPLTPVSKALSLPGIYHVEVDYRYDGLARTAHKSYAVRYINLKLYAGLVIIVLAATWLLRRHFQHSKT